MSEVAHTCFSVVRKIMLVKIMRYAKLEVIGVDSGLVGIIGVFAMTIWGFEWAISSQWKCGKYKLDWVSWRFFYSMFFSDLIDLNFNLLSIIVDKDCLKR